MRTDAAEQVLGAGSPTFENLSPVGAILVIILFGSLILALSRTEIRGFVEFVRRKRK